MFYCKKIKCFYCFTTISVLVFIYNWCTVPRIDQTSTKYILLWTNATRVPFIYLEEGNTVFKKRKCKFVNCYVTADRQFLGSYTSFDVVAFNGPQFGEAVALNDLPQVRSVHQKYVYANIEAAFNYPICSTAWDGFFNWTWTYKLNSDAIWGYVTIKNLSGHVIGPGTNVAWVSEEKMMPVDKFTKSRLLTKSRAGAWFVSNCVTVSYREQFVYELQQYLGRYGLSVDVFGQCGEYRCPRDAMQRCLDQLQRHYYFYLAFENAISEDYVTEKIIYALNHYTVPVVYGGGDYSRFLPPGSYLDAMKLGPQQLAKKMFEAVRNRELYHSFFRWRQYYSYHYRHESPETDDYCQFCSMLNDEALMNKTSVYNKFSEWWTTARMCRTLARYTYSRLADRWNDRLRR